MQLFLLAAAILALGGLVLMIRPLFGRLGGVESRDAKDARLFRQQLAEVERDLERGVIGAEEAEGARAEISRRLIAAAGRAERSGGPGRAPRGLTGLVAVLALIGLPLLAAVVYLAQGAPGLPDMPLAERQAAFSARPSQQEAEAEAPAPPAPQTPQAREFAAMIQQLEEVVAERPDDPQGLTLLANGLMRLGRPAEAWPVLDRLIALRGADAPAELHATKAEAMVMAANGYVSPAAERAIATALERDPQNQVARYYRGLTLAQQARFDEALEVWQALRNEAPEDAPWLPTLDGMMAELRGLADGGSPAPGPDRAAVEAAAEMSPEERQQMIEGMVARLEQRLTTDGGEAEDWARLMASYMQLDRREDALRAYRLGTQALGAEGGASFLRQQALVLGVIEE